MSPPNSGRTVKWVPVSYKLTVSALPFETAGSEGSVTFDDLNPDRRKWYTLRIQGTLPNGDVVPLDQRFHVGKKHSVRKHIMYFENNKLMVGSAIT